MDETQRAARGNRIGSSDAAAICGLSEYRNAYDVWAEKVGMVPPFAGNDMTEAGTLIEPSLIDYVVKKLGVEVKRSVMFDSDDGRRVANLDAMTVGSDCVQIIEGKTCGIIHYTPRLEQWGDPLDGADGVPDDALVQVHHQYAILKEKGMKVEKLNVVALLGGRGFCLYRFSPNERMAENLVEKENDFYDTYIKTKEPPPGGPTLEIAKIMKRVPDKIVDLPDTMDMEWKAFQEAEKQATADKEDYRLKIMAALGDAEAGRFPGGGYLTYRITNRSGYTVEPTSFRQLRRVKKL